MVRVIVGGAIVAEEHKREIPVLVDYGGAKEHVQMLFDADGMVVRCYRGGKVLNSFQVDRDGRVRLADDDMAEDWLKKPEEKNSP